MSKKFTLIVGVLVFTVFILIIVFRFNRPAHSDISFDKASKIYNKISFVDWVRVVLHVNYVTTATGHYFVVTRVKSVNNKTRFIIIGEAYDTPLGQEWFREVGSKIEESVAQDCKIWTMQGYPISLNDFEINIRAPY